MAQPPPFEIPQQLREMTERNVEHARATYGQFMDAVSQAMGAWASAAPANAMMASFKVVQDRAVKFAKQNGDACFNLASEIASAKDVLQRPGHPEPARPDADAGLCAAGAGADAPHDGGRAEQHAAEVQLTADRKRRRAPSPRLPTGFTLLLRTGAIHERGPGSG